MNIMPPSMPDHYCEFAPSIFLKKKRIHQIFGPARIRMLLFLGQKISGPIFWIKSYNDKIFLHPNAISPWINPNRITYIYAKKQNDKLWIVENIIKDRSSRLVVVNFSNIPNFNSVRRLNLEIKSNDASQFYPLCIFFTDTQNDIAGVESRWSVKSLPSWSELKGNCFNLNTERWLFDRTYCRANSRSKWIITLKNNSKSDLQKKISVESLGFS